MTPAEQRIVNRMLDTLAIPIDVPPYSSPEWVAWRRGGLGASDLPTVVGCNPWQTEYQLAALKRGETPAFEGNAATRWGHRMEAVGIEVYQESTGFAVKRGETFADPRYPHLWATLDGRVPDLGRGVEIKWVGRGMDGLPQRMEVQALAQCGLADLDAVDVVALSPHGEPTIHRVDRDDAAIADLLALGEAWYVRYVLGDEMPALDDSPEARRFLGRLRGTEQRTADDDQRMTLANLRQVRDSLARLDAAERGLIRDLKSSMAGTGVLVAPGARVSWAAVKARTTVGWQQVAEGLRTRVTDEEWGAVVSLATTEGEPGDRFAVTFKEETE